MDRRSWYSRAMAVTVLMIVVALVAITSAGCGSSANAADGPLKLGEADNGKAYTVKIGDTIEVIIPGNPTTGFAWTAALAAYSTEASDGAVVGAGGTYTFTFKAAAAGEALIKLVYSRPWESVAPEKTFTVTVTIK
jgi:inhibitor of cysteine peptidase